MDVGVNVAEFVSINQIDCHVTIVDRQVALIDFNVDLLSYLKVIGGDSDVGAGCIRRIGWGGGRV